MWQGVWHKSSVHAAMVLGHAEKNVLLWPDTEPQQIPYQRILQHSILLAGAGSKGASLVFKVGRNNDQ